MSSYINSMSPQIDPGFHIQTCTKLFVEATHSKRRCLTTCTVYIINQIYLNVIRNLSVTEIIPRFPKAKYIQWSTEYTAEYILS